MADEERERDRERGPPEGGDDRRGPRPQGPPPVANSRFAAAAAMAKDEGDNNMDSRGPGGGGRYADRERGPPPTQNSRFAAAAESDRDAPYDRDSGGGGRYSDRERVPPPTQNSRFAQAAAADSDYQERGRGPPPGPRYSDRDRGPPPAQNSRFAMAAAADEDYADRQRGPRDRDGGGRDGMGRGGYGRDERRGYGGERRFGNNGPRDYNDLPRGPRSSMGDLPRGPRSSQMDDLPRGPRSSMGVESSSSSRVDELLKPKLKNVASDNILKAPNAKPAPEHEANMLSLPSKARAKEDDEDLFMKPSKKAESKPKEPEPAAKKEAAAPAVSSEESKRLMEEFASGTRKGEDLKAWVEENRESLPTIDQLVFTLLVEQEKLNPDPECAWAEKANFGAALLSLVEDDIVGQMQVLWGIQFYCDKIGFPKLNDEYIVQAMFRGMYKYDLAEEDAFTEWKEDETEACEKGKLKAIIQTVEWFNWLAEADDDEEEDDEGEEEEEE